MRSLSEGTDCIEGADDYEYSKNYATFDAQASVSTITAVLLCSKQPSRTVTPPYHSEKFISPSRCM